MSEQLPYEEQLPHQWDDLVLPDVNLAWEDMKRRLEEDDDQKPLAWWRRGCMLWGFLLLGLLGASWWLFHPEEWFNSKKENNKSTVIEKKDSLVAKTNNTDTSVLSKLQQEDELKERISQQKINTDSSYSNQTNNIDKPVIEKTTTKMPGGDIVTKAKKKVTIKNNNPITKVKDSGPDRKKPIVRKDDKTGNTDVVVKKNDDKSKDNIVEIKDNKFKPDSLIAVTKIDSAKTKVEKDTTMKEPVAKADSSKNKLNYFSAGIALHEQLPVGGQKLTPYNSLGRKGSLGDYVPSVYFRFNQKDKWFLQAEFRYGAPQHTKEFVYRRDSVPLTGTNPVFSTITSSTLKKTFYHQLPLTFNYYLAPGWVLGAGIQWNKFYSAVAEEQVVRRNNFTLQDSTLSKIIKKENKDSASEFTKNYLLGVIETEYQWRKLSVGARYTYGLQPYIKFTLPGGTQQQRSTTLQIFLRYQLWRSKGK